MLFRMKKTPKPAPLGISGPPIQTGEFSTLDKCAACVASARPTRRALSRGKSCRLNNCISKERAFKNTSRPSTKRTVPTRRHRQGVAAVEAAICLPILLTVTLLFIEFSNLLFLRQTLKVASYEGIRVATKQGSSADDVAEVCQNILDSRQVVDYEISIEPEVFSVIDRGTLVTVSIDVGKSQNRMFGLLLGNENTIEIESYGLKE